MMDDAIDRIIAREIATGARLDGRLEGALTLAGAGPVVGVDEVGRGPLAGPVTAAAIVFDPRLADAVDDSKALSPARREALFETLCSACAVGVGSASAAEIDAINIRRATHLAMRRALLALPAPPGLALIDGNDLPPDLPCRARTFVKGDARIAAVAAASIVAKVLRDRLMARAGADHPGYGFDSNAGYPTARHRAALARLGPCPLHRMSFAPCRAGVV